MLLYFLFQTAALGADYAGAAVCAKCHPAQSELQARSGHAAALQRSKAGQPGEWAFGAGSQAVTFVSRLNADEYLEHGESWFPSLKRMARTPGHRTADGVKYRLFDPSAGILRCFACHSTGPVSLDAEERIVPNELGVRCEDCHGAAKDHAVDPARTKPLNPAILNGAGINDLCGACHRMPAAAGATPDLRDPWNARHQPLLLAASRCFRQSNGKLSCMSCHSPHAPLEREITKYDVACARCHAAPKHKQPVGKRACAECHMPAVKPHEGLSFANHRIAIYRTADPLTPVVTPPTSR